jgi:hypothetical protein
VGDDARLARTFDALIAAVAPSPEVRDRILGNHVYRNMADALSGSQDYMATEKLYDLVRDGRWDLVVLDTPPVKNALDFLESPGRVVGSSTSGCSRGSSSPRRAQVDVAGPSAAAGGHERVLYRLLAASCSARSSSTTSTEFLAGLQRPVRGLPQAARRR